MRLVPGAMEGIENMNYTWRITEFGQEEMTIVCDFSKPNLVSQDSQRPDVVILSYKNTDVYLQPIDKKLKPIKDGYEVVIRLPKMMKREL